MSLRELATMTVIKLAVSAFGREKAAKVFGLDDLFMTGREIPLPGYYGVDGDAYVKSDIVYSCVSKTARDIARCPIQLLRDPDDPESAIERGKSPLFALLSRPCQGWTMRQVVELLVAFYRLRGEAFLVPDNPRSPTQIVPWFDPLNWRERIASGQIVGWDYQQGQTEMHMIASDVMHFRSTNPSNPVRGLSPLAAASEHYQIDTKGAVLKRSEIERGGERPAVYKHPEELSDEQYQQLLAKMMARRSRTGEIGRDVILEGGLDLIDPKMSATDLQLLESTGMSSERICMVFGMSLGLIGKDSSANYVDTFKRRQNIYWQETLMPIMAAMHDVFDGFFTSGPVHAGAYLRFDTSRVDALQQEYSSTLDNAQKLRMLGVPLTVINESLSLGLDLDAIPGADQAWVASGMAPVESLLNDWANQPEPIAPAAKPEEDPESDTGKAAPAPGQVKAGQPNPPPGSRPSVTRAEIVKRASDARAQIQRSRRQLALERGCAKTWRLAAGDVKKDAVAIVRRLAAVPGATAATIQRDLPLTMKDVRIKARKDLPAAVGPYHVRAAALGVFSLQYLLGKVDLDDCDLYLKAPVLSEAARKVVRDRENLVAQMSDDLFDRVMGRVAAAVEEGAQASEVAAFVADEFNASVNRSVTIGRTEVGSAYNASRFTEMGEQGFGKHEWVASVDERSRESHAASDGEVRAIGETFPCGLEYPMAPGGDPGNVINCRCETIPAVED